MGPPSGHGNTRKPGSMGGSANRSSGNRSYVRDYYRTYFVYLPAREGGTIKTTYIPGNKTHNLDWEPAGSFLPYWEPRMSMTNADQAELTFNARKIRVLECGFEISDITPFSDELSNIGGSTVTSTTFNNSPFFYMYVDTEGKYFPQTNSIEWPELIHNNGGLENIPTTRESGTLKQFVFPYTEVPDAMLKNAGFAAGASITSTDDQRWQSLLNGPGWQTVRTGDDCGYTCKVNGPWMNTTSSNFMNVNIAGRKALHSDQSTSNPNYPEIELDKMKMFPSTRAAEIPRRDGWDDSQVQKDSFRALNDVVNLSAKNFAPLAYLQPMQMKATDGSSSKLVFGMHVTYHMKLEIETLYDGYMFPSPVSYADKKDGTEYVYSINNHPNNSYQWSQYGATM